ncbi:UNVERIFIED_ORG: hypothetical protein M2154_001326 [Enterobacter sp. JUb101]|jgi:hypothetical protein|nr:hypothetical protein [Lelliottia amnigena]
MAKNEVATLEAISCVMKPPLVGLLCLNPVNYTPPKYAFRTS